MIKKLLELLDLSKYRGFLTINERRKLCSELNSERGRAIADSKFLTKNILQKKKVPVAPLVARLKTLDDVNKFAWRKLEGNFVIKPTHGYGGEGIIIVRNRAKTSDSWIKMDKKKITLEQIRGHCEDILAGKYSLHDKPCSVLIEERIKIHPKFFAYTRSGTPDIRVILYKKVPVMAMLRLPTEESAGRANLEQGAVGFGIDMASGFTTFAVAGKGKLIETIYSFRRKMEKNVSGIRIPEWKRVLETAIKTASAVPELGYVGVDIVLDKEKGPVVLEVNARPGLSIQICNKAGLMSRIRKLEEVRVAGVTHAYNMARYLFGEKIVTRESENSVVKPIERIQIKTSNKLKVKSNTETINIRAKIDTGAYRSSIDEEFAKKHGLLEPEKILYYRHFKSALGKDLQRPVVGLTFVLAGKKIYSQVSIANRKKLKTKMLIGRKDLRGFAVKLEGKRLKKNIPPTPYVGGLDKKLNAGFPYIGDKRGI